MNNHLVTKTFVRLLLSFSLALLLPFLSFAQWQQFRERLNDPTVPDFVKEMCVPRPKVQKVVQLYEAYYKSEIAPLKAAHNSNPATAGTKFKHEYEKLYKTWRSATLNYITPDGFVDFSPQAERDRQQLIDRIHPKEGASDRAVNWTPVGPMQVLKSESDLPISWQANVFDMAFSKVYPDVIYAGTESGGVFKSSDSGTNWTQVGTDQNFRWVQAVAYWPYNYDYVRIGVPGKLMYSDDGGTTWTQCTIDANGGTISPDFQTFEILLTSDPANDNLAFAATSDGLLISDDYGKTWKKQFFANGGQVTSIVEHPTNPAILYMLMHYPGSKMTYCVKSTNNGTSWELMNGPGWFEIPAADQGKINVWGGRLAVTEAAPEQVYVMLNEANSDASATLKLHGFIGIYSSTNGGTSWTRKTGTIGAPYNTTDRPNLVSWGTFEGPGLPYSYHQVTFLNNAIAASQLDANHLLVGGLSLWESTDGGATWAVKGGYGSDVPNIHPDTRRIRFHKTSPTTEELRWCSDGGLNFSADGTLTSHQAMNKGIFANEFWGFESDMRLGLMGGGSYHNGNNYWQPGYPAGIWKHEGGGEAATGYVQYGSTPRIWFTEYAPFATVPAPTVSQPVTHYSTVLDQDQWRPNAPIGADHSRAGRVLFDRENPKKIYWGSKGKFCHSADDGQTASVLYDFGDDNLIQWIEQSQSNSNVMYIKSETNGGWNIYKTTNGGHSWTQLQGSYDRNIFIATVADDYLYLVIQNGDDGLKTWVSADGGSNFTNITTSALDGLEITAVLTVDGLENDFFIATTNGGVFNYNYLTGQWDNLSQGLNPAIYPTRLAVNYATRKLLLGTRGMGVWESDLNNSPIAINMEIASDFDHNFCAGEPIHFFNRSSTSTQSSVNWSFPGGSPSSSTSENPIIAYSTPGTYPVTLTITDNSLTGTETRTGYITIVGKSGTPVIEDFEDGLNPEWLLIDANNNAFNWAILPDVGGYGNSATCLYYANYSSDEQGARDEVWTVKVDLSNVADANLQFDLAYAMYALDLNIRDSLAVLASVDCGKTFTQIFLDGGEGLSTAPPTGDAFLPTASQWITKGVNLQPFVGYDEVMFAFQNRGHYGNNLFLDNIIITGESVNVVEKTIAQTLVVSPNPNDGNFSVRFELPNLMEGSMSLLDPLGREVFRSEIQGHTGMFEKQMEIGKLAGGLYILNIQGQGVNIAHKIIFKQ